MRRNIDTHGAPHSQIVEGGCYRRSISLDGGSGYFDVSMDAARESLVVRLQFGNPRSLFFIIERIRAMFDLNADWAAIVAGLKSDRVLAPQLEADPGLRVPGCWNGFELATRAILGQQVTVKSATVLAGRIVSAFGKPVSGAGGVTHLFPPADVLAEAPLASVGLTKARAQTIRALARAVCDGHIRFEGVTDIQDFLARLCEIPGIGQWTAQYVAMRALAEPDAFPSSDLGLMRALDLSDPRELERRAESWRPWRAYAAMYLWKNGSRNAGCKRRDAVPRTQRLPLAEQEHQPHAIV